MSQRFGDAPVSSPSLWLPVLIFLGTIAAFLLCLSNGWVWDDSVLLLQNPHYRGLDGNRLRWMFTSALAGPYEPVSWLSYACDYLLWGMSPYGYHLTNLLWHAANAVLFFWLSALLLELCVPIKEGNGALAGAALCSAMLFAVHPLRVESVAWIAERRDVLSGFFYLSAVIGYLRAQTGPPESRNRWLAASWGSFALSLGAKVTGISLPLVFLVLDWYPLMRWRGPWTATRRLLLEKVPFLALSLAFGVVAILAQSHARAVWTWQQHGLSQRLAQAGFGITFYIGKSLIPMGLSPLYQMPAELRPLTLPFLGSAALVFLMSVLVYRLRRSCPAALAIWLSYVLTLFPVLGLLQSGPQLVADRYSYLSCLSLVLLPAAGLRWIWKEGSRTIPWVAALLSMGVVGALGAATWRQTGFWHDPIRLWSRAVAIDPGSDYGHLSLGEALAAAGRLPEAAREFGAALSLNSGCVAAQDRLVRIVSSGKGWEEAPRLQWLISTNPVCRMARNDWVTARAALGDSAAAVAYYQDLLVLEPDNAAAHNNLGRALVALGRSEEASRHFRQSLQLDPDNRQAQENLLRLHGL